MSLREEYLHPALLWLKSKYCDCDIKLEEKRPYLNLSTLALYVYIITSGWCISLCGSCGIAWRENKNEGRPLHQLAASSFQPSTNKSHTGRERSSSSNWLYIQKQHGKTVRLISNSLLHDFQFAQHVLYFLWFQKSPNQMVYFKKREILPQTSTWCTNISAISVTLCNSWGMNGSRVAKIRIIGCFQCPSPDVTNSRMRQRRRSQVR